MAKQVSDKDVSLKTQRLEIELLLQAILKHYGYDFTGYAEASLERRILAYTHKFGFAHISECISHLLHDETMFHQFVSEFTVHTTEMFRDPEFFLQLRQALLPMLSTYPYLNIWVAGCATGEEAYSLAILLKEADLLSRCTIYATDLCENIITKAQKGVFSYEQIRDYTQAYQAAGGCESFSNYYTAAHNNAIINQSLRDNIHFMPHNLISDTGFIQAHLIICRNVLIYFNKPLQDQVLTSLSASLIPQGFLCLGSKETLLFSPVVEHFEIIDASWRLFRKKNDSA